MIRRPAAVMAVLGLCLAATFIGLGLVSAVAVRLERGRERAAQEAMQGESVRLALWRMDSALSTFIAAESARPYYVYDPSYTLAQTWLPAEAYAMIDAGKRFPSPLQGREFKHIRIHFQIGPGGELTSPQAPSMVYGESGTAADNYDYASREQQSSALLRQLGRIVNRESLVQALGQESGPAPAAGPPAIALRERVPRSELSQSALSDREWLNRARQNAVVNVQMQEANLAAPAAAAPDTESDLMRPVWIRGELLLARIVDRDGGQYIQGCWLDWPGINQWLRAEIRDLLPQAELRPVTGRDQGDPGRWLAAIPVELEPGPLPAAAAGQGSAVNLVLALAWAGVLIAAVAVAMLLFGAVSLAERRAAFVSAVTHELRTPLTTLRMYTEMLAEGMVADEDQRRSYIESLRSESERLGHLVENVLSYSRLEKGGTGASIRVVPAEELVARVRGVLEERARQAGMELEIAAGPVALASRVRADVPAVERVLYNLVDNACKYAGRAGGAIRLELSRDSRSLLIKVRDQGPGIPRPDARRLFRPFSKSAQAAAGSAPGVGLGLSLSRKLARNMGGELRLEKSGAPGACFTLSLGLA
jgi:signal transduction histidine kinase